MLSALARPHSRPGTGAASLPLELPPPRAEPKGHSEGTMCGAIALSRVMVSAEWPSRYCSFAYSALACFRMGMSGSASFQSVRKSWYAALALAVSPAMA